MRQSKLFGKTRKDISSEEKSINAELLSRAGFIHRQMAGVYVYLPLGLKVLRKIERVVREEMDNIGGQEVLLSALQPKDLWEKSGRWEKMEPIMYQFEDHHGTKVGLAATHEEPMTALAKLNISSYKDLPLYVYQLQTKYRDEKRAKSGILRGREFSMKDLYSFHPDRSDLDKYYMVAHDAYHKVFSRLGLEAYSVEASGGDMSDENSHEFMVLTDAGEDEILLCAKCKWAQNVEIARDIEKCPNCSSKLSRHKAVEAGNIFKQGSMYSDALGLKFVDKDGKQQPVLLGSYGIGLSRLIGTIVEASHDKEGIIWTKETTPFEVHLLNLSKDDKKQAEAGKIYEKLLSSGLSVLYDDRDISAGKKLVDADLIGICWQLIVSDKNKELELINRANHKKLLVSLTEGVKKLQQYYQ